MIEKIKNIFSSIWSFAKRRKILSAIIVLAVVIILMIVFRRGGTQATTFTVAKGNVVSQVSVTGNVKPSRSLDMAFVGSGRVSRIYVSVGDKVSEGQSLISLDNGDLAAQVAQAQAQLDAQNSKMAQLQQGSRPETIQNAKADLQKAQADLANYYSNVLTIVSNAYTKSNDAVNTQAYPIFYGANSDNPTLTFTPDDLSTKTRAENLRKLVTPEMSAWTKEVGSLTSNSAYQDLDNALENARKHMIVITNMLNAVIDALNSANSIALSTVNSYKTSINLGLTNVNAAATEVSAEQQLINAQKIVVQKSQNQLTITTTPSVEDLAYQQSQVDNARANLAYAQSVYAKTIIRSPFQGMVTKVVPEVGDIISANENVVSVIGSGNYEIEAYITESDISKIKIGDESKVTLDAYGPDVVFGAKVVSIDLSETDIEGVPTYKTTFQFDQENEKILSGLTANVDIMVGEKDGVLYIPTRNIQIDNGRKFIIMLIPNSGGKTKEVDITTGLKGSDGRTEIISGLNEGDQIIID